MKGFFVKTAEEQISSSQVKRKRLVGTCNKAVRENTDDRKTWEEQKKRNIKQRIKRSEKRATRSKKT